MAKEDDSLHKNYLDNYSKVQPFHKIVLSLSHNVAANKPNSDFISKI